MERENLTGTICSTGTSSLILQAGDGKQAVKPYQKIIAEEYGNTAVAYAALTGGSLAYAHA